MKRWNFRGLRASHGVSVSHRKIGATGGHQVCLFTIFFSFAPTVTYNTQFFFVEMIYWFLHAGPRPCLAREENGWPYGR